MIRHIILLVSFLLVPSLSNAGYLYNNICYNNLDNLYISATQDIYNRVITQTISPTRFQQLQHRAFRSYNTEISIPAEQSNCTTTQNKPYCLVTAGYKADFQKDYYSLYIKYRFQTFDITTGSNVSTEDTPFYRMTIPIWSCDINTSNNGLEPVNLNITYPPETFNPSNINPVDAASSIGSGFLLIAVPLAVVWAGRQFLRPLLKI